MERLLSAKHWQLFLATYLLPFLLYVVFAAVLFGNIDDIDGNKFALGLSAFMPIFFLVILVVMVVFYGWYFMVGTRLQQKIKPEHRLNTKYFKLAFFYPAVYIMLFVFGFVAFFSFAASTDPALVADSDPSFPAPLLVVIPLHLLAIFSMFYCMYFLAKTIVTAERQERVSGSDFVGEFFLIWFWPIGIWFLQPRINAIWEGNGPEEIIEDHFV